MSDAIERAKAVDIQRLADRWLDRAGGRKCACPVCPSSDGLHVYEDGAYCYSARHPEGSRQMDAIDICQAVHEVPFSEAVEMLAGRRPEHSKRGGGSDSSGDEGSKPGGWSQGGETALLERLCHTLDLSERGRAYLADRGLPQGVCKSVDIVDATRDEWVELCTHPDIPDQLLVDSGLITSEPDLHPYYDHFIIFPYWRVGGGLSTVRFRATDEEATPKMMSVCGEGPSEAHGPYMTSMAHIAAREGATLWVCEGELDALSIATLGQPAVATTSAHHWPARWCEAWEYLEQVIVVREADEGGKKFGHTVRQTAIERMGRPWAARHLQCLDVPGEDGCDVNDLKMAGELSDWMASVVSTHTIPTYG